MRNNAKTVLGPPLDELSYTDTYFREIGVQMNQDNANTESSDIERDNAADGTGLLEDVSLDIPPLEHSDNEPSEAKTPQGQSLKQQSPNNSLTMASAYAAKPFHSYFGQNPIDAHGLTGKSARYGSITLNDDASVSTLGEDSTKHKSKKSEIGKSTELVKDQTSVSTIGEDSTRRSLKSESVKSTTKDVILSTPNPFKTVSSWDLKPSETASTEEDSQVYSSYEFMLMRRKKCLFFLMAFSTLILFASTLILAISLTYQRLMKTATFVTEKKDWEPEWNGTVSSDFTTSSPTLVDDVLLVLEDLVEILAVVSPNSLASAEDSSSPQFLAMNWLSQDPEYFTYPVERVVQRWAIAVLAYSVGGDTLPVSRRSLQAPSALLSYEHECQWFSSVNGEDVCDATERILGVYLDNHGLAGTIPPEIGLLQDSIEQIDMASNSITGALPTELGDLTNLKRLQLTGNAIDGVIPVELSFLTNLVVLGLGRNNLAGEIPSELGNIHSLVTLGLEENSLVGKIPEEIIGMQSLVHLTLEANELDGEIPAAIGGLYRLEVFSVQHNKLNGTVPESLCHANLSNQTVSMTADCSEVYCPCCTYCCIGCEGDAEGQVVTRTASPTLAPTPTPAPCVPGITVSQPCYLLPGASVDVYVEYCSTSGFYWIFMVSEELFDLHGLYGPAPLPEQAILWSKGCGDQICVTPNVQNVFTGWLPEFAGERRYKMYLVLDGLTIAMSEIFEVRNIC